MNGGKKFRFWKICCVWVLVVVRPRWCLYYLTHTLSLLLLLVMIYYHTQLQTVSDSNTLPESVLKTQFLWASFSPFALFLLYFCMVC